MDMQATKRREGVETKNDVAVPIWLTTSGLLPACFLLVFLSACSVTEQPLGREDITYGSRGFDGNEIIWFDVSGSTLATCRADGMVALRDLENGNLLWAFRPEYFYVDWSCIYLSPSNPAKVLCYFILGSLDSGEGLTVYDYATGGYETFRLTDNFKKAGRLRPLGLSRDGQRFFFFNQGGPPSMTEYDGEAFRCVNVDDGAVMWELPSEQWPGKNLHILSVFDDGKLIGASTWSGEDAGLVVFEPTGRLAWRAEEAGKSWLSHASTITDCLIVYCSLTEYDVTKDLSERSQMGFMAWDRDGNLLWARPGEQLTYMPPVFFTLLTVTPDGKTQVFAEKDRIEIANLPDGESRFLSCREDVEARISPDGRYLAILPRLIDLDRRVDFTRMRRDSRKMRVVDLRTLETVYWLDLTEEEMPVGPKNSSEDME